MQPRVVIVGGGFGGLKAAHALGRSGRVQVTVLDKRNHHLFQPLLYQVATATLNPSDIAVPIRQALARYRNVSVRMETALSVDLAGKAVVTDAGRHPYDYLILAAGASHSYFGHPEWEEFAPGLKTVEQALEIRRRVLTAFEQAEKESDAAAQARLLTFVVIGGGPTGVEMAGALAELAHAIAASDFRNIRPGTVRVILLQGGDRVLPQFAPALSAKAKAALEKKGVEVRLDKLAKEITPAGVRLDEGLIPAANVIWAAGVKPAPLNKTLGLPLDREGRVIVGPDLSLPGRPEVFAIGDQAHFDTGEGPLPGLAPVAMQQGVHAARLILDELAGRPRRPFRYFDKGTMAVIGRNYAVTDFHGLRIGGYFAWLMWLFVHILYLVGFRNRIAVVFNWAWSYLTFKRGARLITGRGWKENEAAPPPAPKPVEADGAAVRA
jgi:NADH:ubiquinone reductase (H+-translocating)